MIYFYSWLSIFDFSIEIDEEEDSVDCFFFRGRLLFFFFVVSRIVSWFVVCFSKIFFVVSSCSFSVLF